MQCACRFRDCMSDEHYVSSLLAAKGEGHNTDCVGMAIHSNHSTGGLPLQCRAALQLLLTISIGQMGCLYTAAPAAAAAHCVHGRPCRRTSSTDIQCQRGHHSNPAGYPQRWLAPATGLCRRAAHQVTSHLMLFTCTNIKPHEGVLAAESPLSS